MRVYNFAAGPAALPEEVLKRAAAELVEYGSDGMSVMEMSHRSKMYLAIYEKVDASIRRVMNIPDNYKVLYLQGGATLQFSAIPMNLMKPDKNSADYALSGNFSKKAYKEAKKYGDARVAGSTEDCGFARIPQQNELTLNPDAAYFHYCMNNTVYGSKWNYVPETGDVPLVCDMSSCILSEPIDVSKFGVIYAGAQKNMGPSGLTVVIVRKDLLTGSMPFTPTVMDWKTLAEKDSMYNTPSCYGIYFLGLVLDWIESIGGLEAMKKRNEEKAKLLYDALDKSSFYKTFVEPSARSMMNVTFNTGDNDLDAKFVKEAAARGIVNIKGYRDLGGMRASIYNAVTLEAVKALVDFMSDFEKENA
ncbi:MAG: 3-phosphoserine/phosphohydroxythreonine transaminase [Oscillospiraceae bacterium]|nr:3-phosphoserine/phosphohydroxythreonine transaminase [Oscillospiraceae bacterium]